MKLEGSVAIVTGAGGGIGAALCRRFVEHGARVVATDLDEGRLTAEVDAIAADHDGAIVALAGDCSSTDHIRATIELAESTFDAPVDLYVANAGVGLGDGLDATPADWRTSIDVNLMAHVRAAELLVPGWLERGQGHFLSTASAAGLLTQIGSATYSVTKHAAVAFAEWLSATYGERGVVVQAICPQGVRTRMLADAGPLQELLSRDTALEPEDVAEAVWQGLQDDRFLILPHPEVADYYALRATQTDRWLAGMRKLQRRLDEAATIHPSTEENR